MIIDAHAHIFTMIAGQKGLNKTYPGSYGMIRVGDDETQMLPPFLIDSSFNAELLIRMMDYSGVDKAVLLQNPLFGIINKEIAEAIRIFPDRFIGTIQVDPLSENAIETIKYFVKPQQTVLKFELSQEWGWTGIHPNLRINNPAFVKIWELASELNLQVIIDPGRIDGNGYQIPLFERLSQKYPGVKILFEHLGYLTRDLLEVASARERRLDLIRLAAAYDNIFLGFSATNSLLDDDYPCQISLDLLKEAVSIAGAEKILWGSDVPTTLTKYTYKQMVEIILKHANFLTNQEKEQVMGNNASRFFNWVD